MLVVYDWLTEYLGDGAPSVTALEDLLTFHAFEIDGTKEVAGKTVIDVKVLPDRSSDCLSHRGIAREIAALTGKPLVYDPLSEDRALMPVTEQITVHIEDPTLCTRFGMALIEGVTIGESPKWLKERLEALGQRSINNVVDATNYVMLSLGQPLHAYDGDVFPHPDGVWRFGVRKARTGESITTLTGDTYALDPRVLLIVDASSDTPVGIAGVKGGKYAEVKSTTSTILLEAAHFDPTFTRRATQMLKLQTDASKRFENAVSQNTIPAALTEAVLLIKEIAEGTLVGYIDMHPAPTHNVPVTVSREHIEALLGLSLTEEVVEDILTRLGFTYQKTSRGWTVIAPMERTDITIPEDVIAEVGRVYGYEHVTAVVPPSVPLTEYNARQYYSEMIRTLLIGQGFSEVITSSFRKKDTIILQNALASDKGCLRSALRENIQETLDRNMPNADLLGLSRIEVFEIGTVFGKREGEKGIEECTHVALGVRTKQQGYTPKDDTRLSEVLTILEGALERPLNARITNGVAEFDLTALLDVLPQPGAYAPYEGTPDVTFTPFSSYPFVSRDIALWVPEGTTEAEVASVILAYAGPLRQRTTLFDAFQKDGRVSYAFRLVFQSFERTLTDIEVNTIMETVTRGVTEKGWEVR